MTRDVGGYLTFWRCVESGPWPDILTILQYIIEIVGLASNGWVLLMLFKLRTRPDVCLTLLRALTISCFFTTLINFINDLYPHQLYTNSVFFNKIVCYLWTSRFSYWLFVYVAAEVQLYFVVNRALQIVGKYQHSFYKSRLSEILYLAVLILICAIMVLPQLIGLEIDGDDCSCQDTKVVVPLLSIAYAQVYLIISVIWIFNSGVMLISCFKFIDWIKQNNTKTQFDTLNELHFSQDSLEKISLYNSYKGWKTSSVCMIPLTVSYIVSFSLDSVYQFTSAIGWTDFIINGPLQRSGGLLFIIHAAIVPIIIAYYLPALKHKIIDQYNLIKRKACRTQLTDDEPLIP